MTAYQNARRLYHSVFPDELPGWTIVVLWALAAYMLIGGAMVRSWILVFAGIVLTASLGSFVWFCWKHYPTLNALDKRKANHAAGPQPSAGQVRPSGVSGVAVAGGGFFAGLAGLGGFLLLGNAQGDDDDFMAKEKSASASSESHPSFNIDGTPMNGESGVDVKGNFYGTTDVPGCEFSSHCDSDPIFDSGSFDSGCDMSSSCGSDPY